LDTPKMVHFGREKKQWCHNITSSSSIKIIVVFCPSLGLARRSGTERTRLYKAKIRIPRFMCQIS
jgi:hypothetical protein